MTPEGKIKAKVKEVLADSKQWGYIWTHWPVPSGFGRSTLDCLGSIMGCAFAIETKAPGHRPTALQRVEIDNLELAGARVFVIDGDSGITELKEWLAGVRRIANTSGTGPWDASHIGRARSAPTENISARKVAANWPAADSAPTDRDEGSA